MASQSAQNAKRARELQKTMDSQQKRLQSVTEPFKGLSREQMDEILGMASRFREQNREEQLKTCPDSGEVQGENGERPPAHAQGAGALNLFNIMEDHPDLVVEALRIQ